MHVAVIGRGLIGSAAARHLALAGHQVTLIGPDEPENKSAHPGVFGSHYDEGRITRALDPHAFWSDASRASIARYSEIEATSKIRFFSQTGTLIGGPAQSEYVAGLQAQRDATGIAADRLEGHALADRFPEFSFDADFVGFHEARGAGHISPRKLVEAQSRCAQMLGAQLVRREANRVEKVKNGVAVETAGGRILAEKAVIAAGGFTQRLCPVQLSFTFFSRTVAFFEVSGTELERLSSLPALVIETANNNDPYMLPPIRYPDGRSYLKLGGDPVDRELETHEQMVQWFRSGGNAEVTRYLTAHMQERIPKLRADTVHSNACVTTFTKSNLPIIGEVDENIHVAVAGCGRGAKCSDELGRLASEDLQGRSSKHLSLAAAGA